MNIRERLKEGILILDGATGTNLQEKGMTGEMCPETWILEHKRDVIQLQRDYIRAGCEVILAPTFTCNAVKLEEYGVRERREELTKELIALTKQAVKEENAEETVYVAGDISMTGEQLYPMGTLTFEDLVEVYKEQVRFSLKEGVDLFFIETMMSLQECRAALLAVKETCDLPVFVSLSYGEDMRTLYGTNPETAMVVLQAMGADAVGLNCSCGPEQMIEAIKQMKEAATVPIIVKPNAGLPMLVDGKTCFSMDEEAFANAMIDLIHAGAVVLGGCCGTTPHHMKRLAEAAAKVNIEPAPCHKRAIRALTTERNTLKIGFDDTFIVVGERINPTGKKELQQQLKDGKFDLVRHMAEEQVAKGAGILDVNMGMSGIDEKERMLQAIELLSNTVDVPLSIDSSHVDVVEAALRVYPGRALINSISLEAKKYEKLIPVAKKYGAMFVLLPLSEAGLPKDLEEKKRIIHTILDEAKRNGLKEEDIIVDGLVTTVSTNKNAAKEVLETIRYCKNELNLATICGLSNISFGLPERAYINSAFLALAIGAGLTMAIANPSQELLTNVALASDVLLGKEGADMEYIEKVVSIDYKAKTDKLQNLSGKEDGELSKITMAVVKGQRKEVKEWIKNALEEGKMPSDIIDRELIPGISHVGELFEKKKYFLPQLIASAETMEIAVSFLEPMLKKEGVAESKGTIIMATVKGDIHDIGKNLVVLMLKNYGYNVIDLGKDVQAERIIKTAKAEKAAIIGLSALMTTTMTSMREVIDLAKKECLETKIIVGGAVITQSFADEIGADGYSKDASEAVKLVERLCK